MHNNAKIEESVRPRFCLILADVQRGLFRCDRVVTVSFSRKHHSKRK